MDLNELRDKVYQCAVSHGWHEENLSNEHFLCLVISELMEAVEADRIGKHSDVAKFKEWQGNSIPLTEETRLRRFKEDFEAYIKDTVEDELADAVIRLLDYCGKYNFVIDDSCSDSEAIEDFLRLFKKMTFTESIFHIVESISRFEIQVAFLKIFGFCKQKDINIFWYIEQKIKYNELRPYKHGNKKY